jgi:hypothetical protein
MNLYIAEQGPDDTMESNNMLISNGDKNSS